VGAVWFGGVMGLLDEAIREHLELKRRSGADPSEVAREEREALAPIFADEHAETSGDDGDRTQELVAESADLIPDDARVGSREGVADVSTVGQDTAELDMQAMMGQDSETLPEDVSEQERLSFE
jgi:hypothetical protein